MEVWIPVSIDGDKVSSWNLACDPEATELVIGSTGSIVLVDVPPDTGGGELLRRVEGSAPAARWIEATSFDSAPAHIFLFDEIAAAAIAAPDLFETPEAAFEPADLTGGGFILDETAGGRIRVTRLVEGADLESILHGAWENPRGGHGGHVHHAAGWKDPLTAIRSFHGHLGPYVVLGYRMGRLALETTGSPGHFEISVVVHCTLKPPRSCLIDGVQLGSGCTLGKRNISVEDFDGPPYAVFNTAASDTVTIKLLPEVPAMVKRYVDGKGVEQAGMEMWMC
jgi:hypothetical protein